MKVRERGSSRGSLEYSLLRAAGRGAHGRPRESPLDAAIGASRAVERNWKEEQTSLREAAIINIGGVDHFHVVFIWLL